MSDINKISRDIFKAIHEGKWIAVEYRNKQQNITKYWIGIKNINPYKKLLIVDGLNVATSEMKELNLYYDSIIDANLIEGSFCEINSKLLEDIEEHTSRYSFIFNNVANLKLLDYYSECNKLDNTPYRNDYKLIDELDVDVIGEGDYNLSNEQFDHLVKVYNYDAKNKRQNKMPRSVSLCMNICSIHTKKGLYRLHHPGDDDDLFELCNYVSSNGITTITERAPESRALGIKPYSTETETAFLETLNHAINAMMITKTKYVVKKEVPISQVFNSSNQVNDLFYTGRFDYIVYERDGKEWLPIFAIELDGNEHTTDLRVIERDKKKQQICDEHNFQLIRVPNNYARRYNYAKEILSSFFEKSRR